MTKNTIDGETGMLNHRFYQCLKDCLNGYRRMTASVKRRLTRMGFRVVEGKKHIKIYWGGHARCCVVSKTASDYKAGLNMASELYRLVLLENGLLQIA